MMRKGKHHKQAVCACATHLLDRVLAVLRSDKPYEVRDTDGAALSGQQARELIVERYSVPAEVRRRTNKRNRRQQADQRAERRARQEPELQPVLDGQLSEPLPRPGKRDVRRVEEVGRGDLMAGSLTRLRAISCALRNGRAGSHQSA